MLLDLKKIVKKYHLNIRGIIHVGAYIGEEYPIYMISNVNLIGQGENVTTLNAEGSEENVRRVISLGHCSAPFCFRDRSNLGHVKKRQTSC